MKISPISKNEQNFGIKFLRKEKKQNTQTQKHQQETSSNSLDLNLLVSDTPKAKKSIRTKDDYQDLNAIKRNMTPEAEQIYRNAIQIAKASHSPELETWHTYLASLMMTSNFIKEADKNPLILDNEQRFRLPFALQNLIYMGSSALYDDEKRKKIIEILDNHIATMQKDFVQRDLKKYPRAQLIPPILSKSAIAEMASFWSSIVEQSNVPDFNDSYFVFASKSSQDRDLSKEYASLIFELQEVEMMQTAKADEKYHIEFYDNKADTMWKNIALGNNVLIINDEENASGYSYLANSFTNLINKPGQKYGDLDPKKTHIIKLSDEATKEFIYTLIKKIKYDKAKQGDTTIITFDLDALLKKSEGLFPLELLKLLVVSGKYKPNQSNVYFAISVTPESYHVNTLEPGPMKDFLTGYAQQSLPILNAADAKEYLANESGLRFISAKIKKEVEKDAVLRVIEVTSSNNGNYPDKAIELLDTVGKYYVDDKKITSKHIDAYLKETENLSETTSSEERSIIFDTGKTLSDIKGMPMTLAEARSIANQIKNGTIGTRGIVIMHSDNSPNGGGRRHTAEAIAGETQIPMVLINAKDFALKDIDALSQEAGLSELKIKKLIQTAKAQAEANKLNTAMIYIDNFDNFGSNPLYGVSSIYEQKAFSQLLAEMEAARKDGKINLVVVGSMNMPEILDSNILKPYKFLNQVIVYQPRDAAQRREILDYYIQKNNLQILDGYNGQKDEILKSISESTKYFSVVDLMYLLDTAKIVSKERGKEAIDKSDFIEAFLQVTTGRADSSESSDPKKKITTSHEAGHALTLQLMYEIAEKSDIEWHLPPKVDFITLDPRGDYGGAMFYKDSKNRELSFENLMAELICDYGGHSSENIIYNMQGSWGITADMQSAEHSAHQAVLLMGMGSKTGVRHSHSSGLMTEKQKELIYEDTQRLLTTAKTISDKIIQAYKPFILEFTEKYYSKVGTGECIIPSEEFIAMLNDWRARQTPEKLQDLEQLNEEIVERLNNCKQGKD